MALGHTFQNHEKRFQNLFQAWKYYLRFRNQWKLAIGSVFLWMLWCLSIHSQYSCPTRSNRQTSCSFCLAHVGLILPFVCPLVVPVCSLVVYVSLFVVPIVISVGLFITDHFRATINDVRKFAKEFASKNFYPEKR